MAERETDAIGDGLGTGGEERGYVSGAGGKKKRETRRDGKRCDERLDPQLDPLLGRRTYAETLRLCCNALRPAAFVGYIHINSQIAPQRTLRGPKAGRAKSESTHPNGVACGPGARERERQRERETDREREREKFIDNQIEKR